MPRSNTVSITNFFFLLFVELKLLTWKNNRNSKHYDNQSVNRNKQRNQCKNSTNKKKILKYMQLNIVNNFSIKIYRSIWSIKFVDMEDGLERSEREANDINVQFS